MKEIASGGTAAREQLQYPTYELGKPICTDIATNISLPLPLSLCRVLILDSSSPVNRAWENGRADTDFRHDAWTFPPGSIRQFEVNSCSEQQLISRGPMTGAQRTITHNRVRNGEMVRLSETLIVEQDDLTKGLLFAIKDEMPRRGFQAKVCIHLRSFGQQSCEARVVTDIRPVGKNISNQQAVHNAYILVLDEMKKRYGLEDKGMHLHYFAFNLVSLSYLTFIHPLRLKAGWQSYLTFAILFLGTVAQHCHRTIWLLREVHKQAYTLQIAKYCHR